MLGALGMRVLVARGRRVSLLPVRGRSRGFLVHQGCHSGRADGVLPLPAAWTFEEGLPLENGIPGFGNNAIPVSYGIRADTVCSSTSQYRPEEPVSVPKCCTCISRCIDRSKGPYYRPRQMTSPTSRDSGACLHHHTTG